MSQSLEQVAELVRREVGIAVKADQLSVIAAALARVAPGMDAERFLSEAAESGAARVLMGRLIDEVTVQETYFFRELRELQAVPWHELAESAAAGGSGSVRVWVSACATGEEAYSLAILASEAFGSGAPPVAVLGTDISTAALQRAEEARYSERSVRHLPAELRKRHFVAEDGRYRAGERLRSLVRFRRHNLVNDPSPPPGEVAFDLIACRNLLIYFDHDTVDRVIGSLETALRPGGHMILGAADRLSGTARRLSRMGRAQPAAERRRERPHRPKRMLRRPLGLQERSPQGPSVARDVPGTGAPVPAGDGDSTTPRRRAGDKVEQALWAADAGDLETAVAITGEVLAENPLDPDAYFARGLAELGLDEADAAVRSFRRALYVDPSFGLAAFELGRAHDARGEPRAAIRAYEQALRTLDPEDERHRVILDQVDLGDVAAACSARLASSARRGSP
jgi:chemotaxis protein methyltransferase CheR